MDNEIKPRLTNKFGDYYVMWFSNSNSYACIDTAFKNTLDAFYKSDSLDDFSSKLTQKTQLKLPKENLSEVFKKVVDFLENFKEDAHSETTTNLSLLQLRTNKSVTYKFQKTVFKVNYGSDIIMSLIHPLVGHLENKQVNIKSNTETISIDLINDNLVIFKGSKQLGSFPKTDFHFLQGKFVMTMINDIHNQTESDWIGLLHASAIAKNDKAIICIGDSGDGKSTLVSLLAANGFDLVADDAVPIKADDLKVYLNPSAVSIKQSGLEVISELWPIKASYSNSTLRKSKGNITYIPMNANPKQLAYNSKVVIHVRYNKDSQTNLKPLDFKKGLELIILQSWLSPDQKNVQGFFEWLKNVQFFELNYSNYEEVISLFENLIEKS